MGDRNNIIIYQPTYGSEEPPQPLYLYSHWHGQELNKVVVEAITIGGDRVGDPTYFTRILFNTMTAEDYSVEKLDNGGHRLQTGKTGFGIGVNGGVDQDMYNIPIEIHWDTKSLNPRGFVDFVPYIKYYEMTYSFDQFVEAVENGNLPKHEALADL